MIPNVCCCDHFPGYHPRYQNCDPDYGLMDPGEDWSKEDKSSQNECSHYPISDSGRLTEEEDTSVIDGVCLACGKIIDERVAGEANERDC